MMQADIKTLKRYTDNGIKLIGTYDGGQLIAGGANGAYKKALTSCLGDIEALYEGKGDSHGRANGTVINAFRFIPKDNGFLIIDIDRNHTDGIDGLALFYTYFEKLGKTKDAMPKALKDIEGGSFPCFVSTPSGGFHLYFKFNQDIKVRTTLNAKGIDIIYTKQATAAGSVKAKGKYILHGELTDAPELYGFIRKHIIQTRLHFKPNVNNEYNTNFELTDNGFRGKKVKNKYSRKITHEYKYTWETIVKFVNDDGYYTGGRNNRAYSLAYKAATHSWELYDTINHLLLEPEVNTLSLKEIKTTAKSAYKGAGKI
ncbi:hypothetical protein AGMMS49531_07590 [Endomicrobiia bacterium]|nr:hypothetical protein AGMMS49531_07590 [Endomicrobiia bacterium]